MIKFLSVAIAAATLLATPVSAASFKGEIWKFDSGFGGGSGALGRALDAITGIAPTETFDVTAIDYPNGSTGSQKNNGGLDSLLGVDAFGSTITDTSNTVMRITGTIMPGIGDKVFSVGSDDGFLLTIGGEELRQDKPRGFKRTSKTLNLGSGPVQFALTYFENSGKTGVEFTIDGGIVDQSYAAPVPLPPMLPAMALVLGGATWVARRRRS